MQSSVASCAPPPDQVRLQKEKRNARQRRLIASKKKTMERLQQQLVFLEREKRRLVQLMTQPPVSETKIKNEFSGAEVASPTSPGAESSSSTALVVPMPDIKRRYLDIIALIEHLRQENRGLTAALYRYSIVKDAIDEVVAHDETTAVQEMTLATTQVPRDIPMDTECCLSEFQAATLGRIYTTQMLAMQRHVHTWRRDALPEQFGWSNLRRSMGECSQFAVKKVILNETALSLWEKTWRAYTTLDSIHRIFPNYLSQPLVHTFDNQVAIVDGSFDSPFCRGAVFHTRSRSADGSRALFGLTTADPAGLGAQAMLHRQFDVPTFFLFEDLPPESEGAPSRVQVHYVVSYEGYSENVARAAMRELAVGVIRWESVCIAPPMLLRL